MKYKVKCKTCHKIFEASHPLEPYCTDECTFNSIY